MKYEEYSGNGNAPRSTDQIQSDLQSIRDEMHRTLEQIEDRFSARELVDQVIERVRHAGDGPTQFVKNLGVTLRDHPVPVLLIGTGVAALLMADREATGRATERARERTGELGASAQGRMSGMASTVREAGEDIAHRAGELKERIFDKASGTGESVSRTARRAGERGRNLLQEEPLVVIGLGLALGAMLGAGTPMSRRERDIATRVRHDAARFAEEAKETAREEIRQGRESAGAPAGAPFEEEQRATPAGQRSEDLEGGEGI